MKSAMCLNLDVEVTGTKDWNCLGGQDEGAKLNLSFDFPAYSTHQLDPRCCTSSSASATISPLYFVTREGKGRSSRTSRADVGIELAYASMLKGVCARSARLARRVLSTLSRASCFTTPETRSREAFKHSGGAINTPDSEDDLGSGDDDVLSSLDAMTRAWQALERENKAHDHTKRRLVEVVKRDSVLGRRLSPFGGVEGIERLLMMREDAQASFAALQDQLDSRDEAYKAAFRKEIATRETLQCEFHALRQHCQTQEYRLDQARADTLALKRQYQRSLSELLAVTREKERLMKEIRALQATTTLAIRISHLNSKKRSLSDVNTG